MMVRNLGALTLVGLLAAGADGAGMTSHNVIARRTLDFAGSDAMVDLAKARTDSIHAGAPYPDFLYACGEEHDAGEATHWTVRHSFKRDQLRPPLPVPRCPNTVPPKRPNAQPFQMAAAEYIREKYPNWENEAPEEDGPGLVAFMMGVVSHYIAGRIGVNTA